MRRIRPIASAAAKMKVRRLWRARDGAIAVEGAFVMIVMAIILVPMVDFAMWINMKSNLRQAVRAGGQYALHDHQYITDSGDTDYGTNKLPAATIAAIESVVQSSTSLNQTLAVTVSDMECYCPSDLDTAVNCPGHSSYTVCADVVSTPTEDESGQPGVYVTITATATFTPYFDAVPWFSSGQTVAERLIMRVN